MSPRVTIRPARPGDTAAIHGLLAENSLTIDGVTYDAFSPLALVAVVDGAVIGYLQGLLGKPYCILTDGVVQQGHREQGIVSQLLAHMETLLREYGAARWVGFVPEKNAVSRSLLERRGARYLTNHVALLKELT